MVEKENLFFKNFTKERSIVKSVSNGTKAIVGVVAAGLAIGLGFKAFGSVSGN